jgi:hypothetical protein
MGPAPDSNLLAITLLAIAIGAILTLPRTWAPLPLLGAVTLVTLGPAWDAFGATWYFLRLVICAGWIRVLLRGETRVADRNAVDQAFLWWAGYATLVAFLPQHHDPREVLPPASLWATALNRGGFWLDAVGGYFLLRRLVRDEGDAIRTTKLLLALGLVVAAGMALETLTSRNPFAMLGGVPEVGDWREGRIRCQGPFTHPIHAGNFGALLTPLALGLIAVASHSMILAGVTVGTAITAWSGSSGALLAWLTGLGAILSWPLRANLAWLRRGAVVLLIGLHLVMAAPVWWVIARVADFVGGGGYWRSKLIDQAVNHFSEWALTGTHYTAHWSPTGSGLPVWPDHMDLTNQFVAEGVHGGLPQLVLFTLLIVRCFQRVGAAWRDEQTTAPRFAWGLGSALTGTIAAFLSVSASLQAQLIFHCLIALIAALPVASSRP